MSLTFLTCGLMPDDLPRTYSHIVQQPQQPQRPQHPQLSRHSSTFTSCGGVGMSAFAVDLSVSLSLFALRYCKISWMTQLSRSLWRFTTFLDAIRVPLPLPTANRIPFLVCYARLARMRPRGERTCVVAPFRVYLSLRSSSASLACRRH